MKITVAIPSYNKEKYIERCLQSVVRQKGEIERIIVVDNCSTDKTLELSKKFEPDVECVRNERNLGMSGNFNRCIELCGTDWLMILHADDELLPDAIKKYKDIVSRHPQVGLVHADSYSVLNGDESTRTLTHVPKKELWKAGTDALSCPYGVCSAVLVRKAAYDALGGFIESSLSSDVEMWARVAGSYDVAYLNSPTVTYHVNPNSTGPESLTTRTVREIQADWDLLNERIAESYPTQEGKDSFLAQMRATAPHSYWAVVKANLRAGNPRNVFDALWLIIFTYRGFFTLLGIIGRLIVKRVKAWL